jgi:hypothetical protein
MLDEGESRAAELTWSGNREFSCGDAALGSLEKIEP